MWYLVGNEDDNLPQSSSRTGRLLTMSAVEGLTIIFPFSRYIAVKPTADDTVVQPPLIVEHSVSPKWVGKCLSPVFCYVSYYLLWILDMRNWRVSWHCVLYLNSFYFLFFSRYIYFRLTKANKEVFFYLFFLMTFYFILFSLSHDLNYSFLS